MTSSNEIMTHNHIHGKMSLELLCPIVLNAKKKLECLLLMMATGLFYIIDGSVSAVYWFLFERFFRI